MKIDAVGSGVAEVEFHESTEQKLFMAALWPGDSSYVDVYTGTPEIPPAATMPDEVLFHVESGLYWLAAQKRDTSTASDIIDYLAERAIMMSIYFAKKDDSTSPDSAITTFVC